MRLSQLRLAALIACLWGAAHYATVARAEDDPAESAAVATDMASPSAGYGESIGALPSDTGHAYSLSDESMPMAPSLGGNDYFNYSGPGFYAGFEEAFVRPYFSRATGIPVGSTNLTGFTPLASSALDFNYDGSPRVYLGYVSCEGLGARIRYWNFDHAAETVSALNQPAQGLDSVLTGHLRAQTLDLEATQQVCFGHWSFDFAGGARYADLQAESQLTFATTNLAPGGGIVVTLPENGHSFHGIGPTLAIEAIRPLGGSHLALFSNGRVSLLFGDSNTSLNFLDPAGVPVSFAQGHSDLEAQFELQFGVQWSYRFQCGSMAFMRTAMEGQVWDGGGSLATDQGNLGFFGMTFGGGFSF